jgi:imidazolonepropionase-like amidohydrolase
MTSDSGSGLRRRDVLRWLTVAAGGGALAALELAEPAFAAPGAGANGAAASGVTILTHATVIDATGAPAQPDATIVLVGDRIVAVGPHAPIPEQAGVQVVDLRGKYVLPGLWDAHTHWFDWEEVVPPLMLANGVTGTRVMWGFPEMHTVRDRINAGITLGPPRVVMASSLIDGPYSYWAPDATEVRTEDEAREAVRQAIRDDADFVKVYSFLSRDNFAAIADEARSLGISFAGHIPSRVPAALASDLGQRSFEHWYGLTVATSAHEDDIRRDIDALPVDPAGAWFSQVLMWERLAADSYSPTRAAALFERLVRNGTVLSPTLTVMRTLVDPAESHFDDPRLRYFPQWLRDYWTQAIELRAPSTPERQAQLQAYYEAFTRLVANAHQAGVGVIAGTDTGNPFCFPGFSIHDEMALLVAGGLTPMQAIQSATRDAATFVGLGDSVGTVTHGMLADLLIVDADPLADIRNTQKIHAIVAGGRYISSDQRAQILADIEAGSAAPALAATTSAVRKRLKPCNCH